METGNVVLVAMLILGSVLKSYKNVLFQKIYAFCGILQVKKKIFSCKVEGLMRCSAVL